MDLLLFLLVWNPTQKILLLDIRNQKKNLFLEWGNKNSAFHLEETTANIVLLKKKIFKNCYKNFSHIYYRTLWVTYPLECYEQKRNIVFNTWPSDQHFIIMLLHEEGPPPLSYPLLVSMLIQFFFIIFSDSAISTTASEPSLTYPVSFFSKLSSHSENAVLFFGQWQV